MLMWQKMLMRGSNTVTARSVVFDIADNWGSTSFVGVRSIEFRLEGVLIPMPETAFTAYATSILSSSYLATYAFDTTLLKTNGASPQSWLSNSGQVSSQRLIIVFDVAQSFDEIVINNYHSNGISTNIGAKTVKITATPDVYSTTTYNAAVTNGTVLNTSEWPQHVAANTVDDQTVWAA